MARCKNCLLKKNFLGLLVWLPGASVMDCLQQWKRLSAQLSLISTIICLSSVRSQSQLPRNKQRCIFPPGVRHPCRISGGNVCEHQDWNLQGDLHLPLWKVFTLVLVQSGKILKIILWQYCLYTQAKWRRLWAEGRSLVLHGEGSIKTGRHSQPGQYQVESEIRVVQFIDLIKTMTCGDWWA